MNLDDWKTRALKSCGTDDLNPLLNTSASCHLFRDVNLSKAAIEAGWVEYRLALYCDRSEKVAGMMGGDCPGRPQFYGGEDLEAIRAAIAAPFTPEALRFWCPSCLRDHWCDPDGDRSSILEWGRNNACGLPAEVETQIRWTPKWETEVWRPWVQAQQEAAQAAADARREVARLNARAKDLERLRHAADHLGLAVSDADLNRAVLAWEERG